MSNSSNNNSLVPYDGGKPPAKRPKSFAKRSASLRKAMMAAVTPEDIQEIVKLQVFLALRGDPYATREILDRTIGKPATVDAIMAREDDESVEGTLAMSSFEPCDMADLEAIAMDSTVPERPKEIGDAVRCDEPADDDVDEASEVA